MHISDECGSFALDLLNVLPVPHLKDNLISQGVLDNKGLRIVTFKGRITVLDSDGFELLIAHKIGSLYFVTTVGSESIQILKEKFTDPITVLKVSYNNWHARLGHAHGNAMSKIESIKEDTIESFSNQECDSYIRGKMKQQSYSEGEIIQTHAL